MSESDHSPEAPQYSREEALAAFESFVRQGITSPDDLPLEDPQVVAAGRILDSWSDRAEREALQSRSPSAMFEFELSRSTFYIDAGFSDPDYLLEVAEDWLVQNLDEAEEKGLTDVAAKIQAKIDEILARLEP